MPTSKSNPLSLVTVNALSAEAFVRAFGDVAECSPWVAELAGTRRPFTATDKMVAVFSEVVTEASKGQKLKLLRAHPHFAGRAAATENFTEDSTREQSSAGLDQLTRVQLEQFTTLNTTYRDRFGFPFIFAVSGAGKLGILGAYAERIDHDPDTEIAIALQQVTRIFRFRIEQRVES